eukprot:scaffold622_cov102-Cylindrotheca_fusiformis.AAC.10
MSDSKRIVIVGAGASARLVTKYLKASKEPCHITIIQPNEFSSVPFYQTLVLTKQLSFVENTAFNEVDGADVTVYGVAVGCSDGSVEVRPLDSGKTQQIFFDVLVCATGFGYPVICETPGQSKADRIQEIDQYADALTSGNEVAIAGGGTVGVELAGDLLEKFPEARGKVTLISASRRLLMDQSPYHGEKCQQILEDMGCKFIFSDCVVSHKGSEIATGEPLTLELESGKMLSCHAYVAAYGRSPNTGFLTKAAAGPPLPRKLVNNLGKVVVDEYLQSTVYDKLYALGATNTRKEPSLYMNIEEQAKTVAKNIVSARSAKQAPGVDHAMYVIVGHDTYAAVTPENLPMPSCCATLCCVWCGFPCNMLCPCFCVATVCGPCDPMVCGYCCDKPEGRGPTKTFKKFREANVMTKRSGYCVDGKPGFGEEMERS